MCFSQKIKSARPIFVRNVRGNLHVYQGFHTVVESQVGALQGQNDYADVILDSAKINS